MKKYPKKPNFATDDKLLSLILRDKTNLVCAYSFIDLKKLEKVLIFQVVDSSISEQKIVDPCCHITDMSRKILQWLILEVIHKEVDFEMLHSFLIHLIYVISK